MFVRARKLADDVHEAEVMARDALAEAEMEGPPYDMFELARRLRAKVSIVPEGTLGGPHAACNIERREITIEDVRNDSRMHFGVAHELAHIIAGIDCQGDWEEEGFINICAGALFMPSNTFLPTVRSSSFDIAKLAKTFNAGFEPVARRILDLRACGPDDDWPTNMLVWDDEPRHGVLPPPRGYRALACPYVSGRWYQRAMKLASAGRILRGGVYMKDVEDMSVRGWWTPGGRRYVVLVWNRDPEAA